MTPLLHKYNEIKEQLPDSLLMVRLGDFYMAFGEDAETIALLCGTQISVGVGGQVVTGFLAEAASPRLQQVADAGYSMAICDDFDIGTGVAIC